MLLCMVQYSVILRDPALLIKISSSNFDHRGSELGRPVPGPFLKCSYHSPTRTRMAMEEEQRKEHQQHQQPFSGGKKIERRKVEADHVLQMTSMTFGGPKGILRKRGSFLPRFSDITARRVSTVRFHQRIYLPGIYSTSVNLFFFSLLGIQYAPCSLSRIL